MAALPVWHPELWRSVVDHSANMASLTGGRNLSKGYCAEDDHNGLLPCVSSRCAQAGCTLAGAWDILEILENITMRTHTVRKSRLQCSYKSAVSHAGKQPANDRVM